ncbi:transferase [Helicobacter sp. 16-1353]|uniref:acyltransferase n=1 Tax=Helicobacter sp. 16-1353 TaxID=2004996 RepID=UPI000DCB0D36|nr:transferase [Helicobacter sp. 16-1353]RAX51425.1 transferase [Helicobacter sp. 16-1353]
MNSFYSKDELAKLGLKSFGENVYISKKASLYNVKNISLDSNIRIDDFAILSGKITIGSFVHIGAGSLILAGENGIDIEDFVGISSGVKIYGSSDDYSGESLTNPMIPNEFKNLSTAKIHIQKHSLIGSTSIILPSSGGTNLGVSIGAFSLVMRPTKEFGIYFGIPAKRIAERNKKLLDLEKEFLAIYKNRKWGGVAHKTKIPLNSPKSKSIESKRLRYA